jgi:hypothetical protein
METMGDTMNKKSVLHYAVLAAFVAAYSATAVAVDEVEFNSPIQTANRVTIGGDRSVTINAVLSGIGDVDYFSFEGKKDDIVQVDIDGGMKTTTEGVDTMVALFGAAPATAVGEYDRNYHKWAENGTARNPNLDENSVSDKDARINEFKLPSDGIWVVGVSHTGKVFQHGGGVTTSFETKLSTGSYTLRISGVTPLMQVINIDVKPGNADPSPVNPKAKGVIPVALLGASDFNVKEVDVSSLTFGATGDESTLRGCQKNAHDFNGDGFPDLLCHFENGNAAFDEDDLMGTVKGKKAGKAFRGHGRLKVMPKGE